jgi:hypothetical protein
MSVDMKAHYYFRLSKKGGNALWSKKHHLI